MHRLTEDAAMEPLEIPLFPLNMVLFPGGPLPLRIFEPRYLDMVSMCMKHNMGFGVVLIREGAESGEAAEFFNIGTLTRILDFDQLEDGLLGISCCGERKLRVLSHRVRSDQLIIGQVELQPREARVPVPEDYISLSEFLSKLLQRQELQALVRLISEDWDSAAWVGSRLAELLPLEPAAKQGLLELQDPLQRLYMLDAVLRRQKII